MKVRKVHMARIRPEKLDEYKEYHRNVWPGLEDAYRQAGITQISCFLHENQLLIFTEYDDTIYPASQPVLSSNEFEQRWQALMRPMADPAFKQLEFEEAYWMPPSSPA